MISTAFPRHWYARPSRQTRDDFVIATKFIRGASAKAALTRLSHNWEEVANAIKALTPLGRTGVPEDIGLIAAFLASDEARWLTGEIIFGSGGLR
ncbi:MAG: hypothetical protein DMF60_04030 [Acidobacteria bacterium]|nr:MAG: hypothetical protein DMF60_04030 [Acidobacteriota bacterium]